MRLLQCNLGAAAALVLTFAISAGAQEISSSSSQPNEQQGVDPNEHQGVDRVKFVTGAAVAFLEHEGDHVLFDVIFDAHPYLKSIRFGAIPFFAVAHDLLSPRREFIVSSAGFWTQEATSEWLLSRRPDFRHEHAPFETGAFAFDILTSVGYAAVAMVRAGPVERDTRSMAVAIGVDERVIGALVLTPALLDAYRYFSPETRWAAWTSRLVKLGSAALVLKQTSSPRQ